MHSFSNKNKVGSHERLAVLCTDLFSFVAAALLRFALRLTHATPDANLLWIYLSDFILCRFMCYSLTLKVAMR